MCDLHPEHSHRCDRTMGRGYLNAGTDVDCEGFKQGDACCNFMLCNERAQKQSVMSFTRGILGS